MLNRYTTPPDKISILYNFQTRVKRKDRYTEETGRHRP